VEPQLARLVRRVVAITAAVIALPVTRIVLDSEAVADCPEGLPDFHALLRSSGCATACFYAFPGSKSATRNLRGLALVERRAALSGDPETRPGAALQRKGKEGPGHVPATPGPWGSRVLCPSAIYSRYKSGPLPVHSDGSHYSGMIFPSGV
jgi:hypothetical protein